MSSVANVQNPGSSVLSLRPLKSLAILKSGHRNASVDVMRGLAILTVVLYHSDLELPYGYLGVDLFFVISGFLVGGLLVRPFFEGRPIEYGRFVLSRGFKIWPSYYAFLAVGQLVAFALYRVTNPEQVIPWRDLPMYLLFYRNYRGHQHWVFDHTWSLCVEEHFYVTLPLLVLAVRRFFKGRGSILTLGVGLGVLAGIAGKALSHKIHFETYSATHNRLDALAWGVLLAIAHQHYGVRVTGQLKRWALLLASVALLVASIVLHHGNGSPFFNDVLFHSLVPVACAGMILALLDWDLSRTRALFPLRFCAYYSYNWYLWHCMFVKYAERTVAPGWGRTGFFLALTFSVAVFFTIVVEEPLLALRNVLLVRQAPGTTPR